jgi:membrane associated rhomboid family serine protease
VAFVLEGWALTWSTCGVSAFVLIYAFARAHTNTGTMFVFALSGAVGAIFTLIANLLYQRRSEKLRTWRPRAGDRQESPPAG